MVYSGIRQCLTYQAQTQDISNVVNIYLKMLEADYNQQWNYVRYLITNNNNNFNLSEQFRLSSNSYVKQVNEAVNNL